MDVHHAATRGDAAIQKELHHAALLEGRAVDGEPLPTAVLVADDAELGVRGFLTIHLPARDADLPPGVAEVAALYVHPQRWRSGTGAALLAAGLARAAAAGATAAVLWVLTENLDARGFYARQGFAPDGWSRAHVGVEELRLRRGTL